MHKVIAISGYSGSGKTEVSQKILKNRKGLVYFDFGYLFRPITYYLMYELNLPLEKIKELVENNKLNEMIKISHVIENKKVRIGVNGKFYDEKKLNSLAMNLNTVSVGAIIGDSLSNLLKDIIDDLKENNDVLLNARRPVVAYPELDCHIFLKADFTTRVKRKMLMNNENYEITYDKLLKRDELEKSSGFWEVNDFTHVIDTTDLCKDDVLKKVCNIINEKKINNLTLVLSSYKCNKNCPYCIAKNNMKFNTTDNLENVGLLLRDLRENNIKAKRFVISGNGEPSLYSLEELKKIRAAFMEYRDLFQLIRIHSSGNIFFEEDKFDLFNKINTEFEILRVSLDASDDMKILGYNQNYLDSELFKKCNNVKCDIALTNYLNENDIEQFLSNNPSIKKIRFKTLLGMDSNTSYGKWINEHSLKHEEIQKVIKTLKLSRYNGIYISDDKKIIYKPSGDYDNDYVISGKNIQNYECENYNIKQLIKRLNNE